MCMRRLVKDATEEKKNNNLQLLDFHYARGILSMDDTKECRKALLPGEWWETFRDGTPKLKRFAI